MNVLEAILTRRSVRAYDSRPIEPASYDRLLQALRFAPSACNFQPWRFILVQSAPQRQKLAAACRNQSWMAQAPLIVVACGLPDAAYKFMGGHGNSVDIDLAIALDHLSLCAVAEGLGSCWIGAFDEVAVQAILDIPAESVKVVALMPVGYPQSPGLLHPAGSQSRKKPELLFCFDSYPKTTKI